MRKRILSLLFLTTAFWGCTKIQITRSLLYDDESLISTCTKAEEDPSIFPFKAEDLDKDYFISGTDLEDYIHYKSLCIGHDIIIKDIEPFTYQNAILFYVMNYENGWEIVSADKRTPYLVAKGESGSFTMKDYQSTPWGTWMFSIGMDILNTRLNGTVVSHEENDNLRFWELISNPERVLGSPSIQSIPPDLIPPGHYELVSTYTQFNYDSICVHHLTSTRWHQNLNDYVPYRTDTTYLKALAGCVAISGAQMLFYLHNNLGVPAGAPDYAYCFGNIDSYQMGQSGNSTTIWNQMTTYGNSYAAILVANAGTLVGMHYGNNGSSASTADLVDQYFGYYGIHCNYNNYDSDAIRTELIYRGMPIIARADSFVPFDTWSSAHSFIIDGYNYSRNKTTYVYEWRYDVDPNAGISLPLPPEPYVVETYTINTIEFIKMNWGWGNLHCDDEFSIGGDWAINLDGYYNFIYSRKMISGFSVNQS